MYPDIYNGQSTLAQQFGNLEIELNLFHKETMHIYQNTSRKYARFNFHLSSPSRLMEGIRKNYNNMHYNKHDLSFYDKFKCIAKK